MDKGDFAKRFNECVRDNIRDFGRHETAVPNVGHVSCKETVALSPEIIAALKAIGERARQDVPAAPLRIADGLRNFDVLQSELNIGPEALNG